MTVTTQNKPVGMTKRASLFDSLNALADEISTEKTAAAKTGRRGKQADGPTPADPGGYSGASSHPSAQVDNNVQDASEGERSSENESDVNEDQGAPGVNQAPDAPVGSAADDQVQIGTNKQPTGEDAASEDDYKDTKDDPGTSHPAKADDGEKYSAVSFKEGHAKFAALANDVLADLANGFGKQLATKSAAGTKPVKPAAPAVAAKTAAAGTTVGDRLKAAGDAIRNQNAPADDKLAGYELALQVGIDKSAAVAGVTEGVEQIIRDGQLDAHLLGSYLTKLAERRKRAEGGGEDEGEDHSSPGDDASGAGGSDGGEGSGADAGGPPAGGGAGGTGLEELLGGGGGGGGMAGGPGGPGGPGGGDPQIDALQNLAAALDELGIPIEALAQAAPSAGGMGGAMGGAPPPPGGGADPLAGLMGGGAPPPPGGDPAMGGAPPPDAGMKIANAVRRFKLSGKYQLKAAANPRERAYRDHLKDTIREMFGLA